MVDALHELLDAGERAWAVRTAQAALLILGFSPGRIDGVIGNRTRKALRDFQIANNLTGNGELDGDSYDRLWKLAFA
ncbi:MAG: peptidoglycan-binding domain-containing protein [Burkholderiaceae bacterium]